MKKKISIIGAGLAGSLLAIILAKKGYKVDVFEKRADMRKETTTAGRSINLALSDRGIRALKLADLDDFIANEVVPMKGRLVHSADGTKNLQPYSGREGHVINSVSRGDLNIALINKAESYPNVNFYFNQRVIRINYDKMTFKVKNEKTKDIQELVFNHLFGTDGAGSVVRLSYQTGGVHRFSYSQDFLNHGYKELCIPAGINGEYQIESDALHIWPRHDFMMIALPNLDKSFTVTLFHRYDGECGFDNLDDDSKILEFFEKYFPDAYKVMPNLIEDWHKNPTSSLATVKCSPWFIDEKSLILGDASHAVVPFYGQGMNASFEDCRVLSELIDEYEESMDWSFLFEKFQEARKKNTDAIADLALQNYVEMRSHVANPVFQVKRQIEMELEKRYADFSSKYSLVTFNDEVPYWRAKKLGELQDEYLMSICSNIGSIENIDYEELYKNLKEIDKNLVS